MSTLDPIRPVTDAAVNTIADKVGNLVGTLWDYSLGLLVNVIFLSRKADEVAEEMGRLQSLHDDLKHKAEAEARQNQANVSNQLERWVTRVASLAEDAANFQRSYEDRSTCITRFRLGYDAVELLKRARKLAEEGNVFSGGAPLTCPRGLDSVEQVPFDTSSSTLVGGRDALRQVEGYIMDDGVGIIGIYGMGGVGKTTLLKLINNEFLRGETCRKKFDVAIWVTVSRDVRISNIRENVAGRLGLPSNTSKDQLFRHLSKKRFIFLLDDVWKNLDLVETGIPLPQTMNHSGKILFTTRYEQVCGEMDADQMVKINSLDDKSSWELFRSKLGRGAAAAVLDNNPSIRQLAKEVVRRCGGLPIALITVGRAMSNAKTTYEWKDAIRKLDQCAAELSPGMEEVLKSLKFSFEMLKDEAHRNCLLYCALFPEDSEIPKEKIIDYWIGEGFLDAEDFDEDNIEDTRCRGNVLIRELQKACLLEEGSDDRTVMLHDTVRDMALWIAGHDFVVLTGSDSSSSQPVPKSSIWENAKKISISLMYNCNIKELPSSFPNLTTLLLGESHCGNNFLRNVTSMPALRVLDILRFEHRFPIEITSFTSLQYLHFMWYHVDFLPVELGNLTNLRILHMGYGRNLKSIPAEAISRLSHLQVLNMGDTQYEFDNFNTRRHRQQLEHPQQLKLSDLANLKRLSELNLPVLRSWASLGVIAASPVLQRSTRDLHISVFSVSAPPPPTGDTISEQISMLSDVRTLCLEAHHSDPVMGELQLYPISRRHQNLEDLRIKHFKEAKFSINNISFHGSEPLFPRLRKLRIENCDGCLELTWVGWLPCLEKLYVTDCEGLREVMLPLDGGGSHDHHPIMPSSFPKLKFMILDNLPSLRSISPSTLLFPCLEGLAVHECPRLQRLPFGPQSAKNLQFIYGGPETWWDRLEWDDEWDDVDDAHQQSFSSKFRVWDDVEDAEEFFRRWNI